MQYVIATGSGREKNLKVWDLEEYFKVMPKQDGSSGDNDHSRFHKRFVFRLNFLLVFILQIAHIFIARQMYITIRLGTMKDIT